MKRIYGYFENDKKFVENDGWESSGRVFDVLTTHDKTINIRHKEATAYTLFYDNNRCGTCEQIAELK